MNKEGQQILQLIKATAGMGKSQFCIPVGKPVSALLRPVATSNFFLNSEDIKKLTDWRNLFVKAFLTEFQATEAQTKKWLVEIVGPNPNKILFMVDDINSNTFAYMGIDYIDWNKKYGEADAIVRGEQAPHGTMKLALLTLLDWAKNQLGLKEIGIRVLSDNTALEFYHKVGFRDTVRVPLRKVHDKEKICWKENKSIKYPSKSLVKMILLNKKFSTKLLS